MAATTYELIVKTVDQTSGPMGRITGGLGKGKIAFAAVATAATVMGKAMLDASKQMETITNQLRLVTKNSTDLAQTQTRLTQLARANRSTLGPTVELYTKLKVATEELGFSNQRVEGLVTKLTQALVVAGADAGTTAGVIRQFGQAMASGTVRGDEFNSIVEGLGPALAIMARESGVTVGQLREMSQNGELTAAAFAALLEGSNELTTAFEKMQTPLDTLEDQLSEAFTTYLANLSESIGLTSSYRSLLETLIGKFDSANQSMATQALTVESLTQNIAQLKQEQEGLNIDQGGHAGRNARRRNEEIQATIEKMEQYIEVLKKQQIEEQKVAEQQKRAAEALAFKQKMAQHEKDVALQSIEGYLKLADSVRNVNAEYEMATPLEQAKMRLEELQQAQRALVQTQNDGIIVVEDMHLRMRGLSEAIILQEAEIAKLIEAQKQKAIEDQKAANAAMQRETAASRLIASIKREEADLRSLTNTLNNVGEIARKLGIDEAKLTEELKKQINAINGVTTAREKQKTGMQTYSEFLDEVNKKARENIRLEGFVKKAHDETIRSMLAGDISGAEARARLDVLGIDRTKPKGPDKPKELTAAEQLTKRLKEQKAAYDSLNLSQEQIAASAKAAGVSQDVFRRELEKTREGMNIFKSDAMLAAEEMQRGFMEAGEALGNELGAAIANGEDVMGAFRNFFKRTLTMILQDILTSGIQKAFAGQFAGGGLAGGAGGGISSLLGNFLSGSGGGGFSLGGIGDFFTGFFKANGGPVFGGNAYMVGERGPELFMPGTTGSIVSTPDTADMLGGGLSVNFSINAIDTKHATEFILENKQQIVGVINQAYNKRGRQGIV